MILAALLAAVLLAFLVIAPGHHLVRTARTLTALAVVVLVAAVCLGGGL